MTGFPLKKYFVNIFVCTVHVNPELSAKNKYLLYVHVQTGGLLVLSLLLFLQTVDNSNGKLCGHYPALIVIPEVNTSDGSE